MPAISILNGMQMLVSVWNSVSIETIVNCFRKAGIFPANQEAVIAEEDEPFEDLQDEIDVLRNVQPDLIPADINASSLIDVDSEVSLCNHHLQIPNFWRSVSKLVTLAMEMTK